MQGYFVRRQLSTILSSFFKFSFFFLMDRSPTETEIRGFVPKLDSHLLKDDRCSDIMIITVASKYI